MKDVKVSVFTVLPPKKLQTHPYSTYPRFTPDTACPDKKRLLVPTDGAGWSIFGNLGHVKGGVFGIVGSTEFCQYFDPHNASHFSFTFARNPITRFVSAYAEIEHLGIGIVYDCVIFWSTLHLYELWVLCPSSKLLKLLRDRVRQGNIAFQHLKDILDRFPAGSLPRATAFLQEFLKDGINGGDGHVKPQVEFLGSSQGCRIPIHFVGSVEHMAEDWARTDERQSSYAKLYSLREGG